MSTSLTARASMKSLSNRTKGCALVGEAQGLVITLGEQEVRSLVD